MVPLYINIYLTKNKMRFQKRGKDFSILGSKKVPMLISKLFLKILLILS
jgi:hypothetical protein